MKILILGHGRYSIESKDPPEVGRYYDLEDSVFGTAAQNRAFHSLLFAFWNWMHKTDTFQIEADGKGYDLTTPDPDSFKELFKARYCDGFDHYEYADIIDKKVLMVKEKIFDNIPDYVIDDFHTGNRFRIKGVLKSWTKYTKKERKTAIDTLLTIIYNSGCDDKKVYEIIDGMEGKK